MTGPTESLAEVATRRESDQYLIPEGETPHTAIDYKTTIATALGFEVGDQRHTGSFSRPVIERLYIILFEELPSQSTNLNELKYEIASEVGLDDADRFLDTHNVAYKRKELIDIYDVLKEYTHGDVQETLSKFDLCPVCDSPVEKRSRVESAGRVTPPDEYKLCLYLDGSDIVVVEHVTSDDN